MKTTTMKTTTKMALAIASVMVLGSSAILLGKRYKKIHHNVVTVKSMEGRLFGWGGEPATVTGIYSSGKKVTRDIVVSHRKRDRIVSFPVKLTKLGTLTQIEIQNQPEQEPTIIKAPITNTEYTIKYLDNEGRWEIESSQLKD